MSKFVLVDYENVGPGLRSCAIDDDAQVLVFLGKTNAKVHPHVQRWLGRRAEYITLDGHGPNALDFHISYYIGTLLQSDVSSQIRIISCDRGFDPLIRHLRKGGRAVDRFEPVKKA